MTEKELRELKVAAAKIRLNIVRAVFAAKSGHPGGSLSSAEIFTYLYFKEMNINPDNPTDPDRDRFVLSKGHCAPGLYSTLALRGYFHENELDVLRHTGEMLQGHPDMKGTPGVDMSTGSLGQGVSATAGMALAGKIDKKDYRVYALLGDGESEEGQVWEAAMFASHKNLDNFTLIIDVNGLQIDGRTCDVCGPEPLDTKMEAFGFNVIKVDGHDFEQLEGAFNKARETKGCPTAIIACTTKGKGVSFMEDQAGWHGKAPNAEEYETAKTELEAALAEVEV